MGVNESEESWVTRPVGAELAVYYWSGRQPGNNLIQPYVEKINVVLQMNLFKTTRYAHL